MAKTKLVKRYANRKLYDTDRSCYVTLEDIAVMIREGDDVHVLDNKTGQDLTTVTLAQIIFEAEKKKNFMPMDLLRGLIKDSTQGVKVVTEDALAKLQNKVSSVAQSSAQHADEAIQTLNGHGVDELFSRGKTVFEQLETKIGQKLEATLDGDSQAGEASEDLAEIKRRMKALEQRLAGFAQ